MSLHLGSSKYDEHIVRKGISNRHFDHGVNKGTVSISIPCALSASQATTKTPALGTRLPSHATSGCPPINAAPCGRGSFPSLSPEQGCRPARLGTAPHRLQGSIPGRRRAVPPGKAGMSHRGPDQRTAGDATTSGQGSMGLAPIASAGKASKAGSTVSVASQEQPRRARLTAESSPVRTVTPKRPSCLPVNLPLWTLQLQLYLPCLFKQHKFRKREKLYR